MHVGKADFIVIPNPHGTGFICAYICVVDGCGKPVVSAAEDMYTLFRGVCVRGHATTVDTRV